MKLSQFDFNLPQEKIATEPSRWRDECKLMVLHKDTGEIEHKIFKNVIDYFGKGDLFVLNDTKVIPARLFGKKEKTEADIMVFLLRELNPEQKLWDVIVEPARKIRGFWALLLIFLPVGLLFAQNSLYSLQGVTIIAAFPVGILLLIIVVSFFRDCKKWQNDNK